jgi:hypothetical protein
VEISEGPMHASGLLLLWALHVPKIAAAALLLVSTGIL